MAGPVWRFYEAPGGGRPVEKDIEATFKHDTMGKTRLLALMKRIAAGETLGRDVKNLGGRLCEARLTHRGGEFRLFFTKRDSEFMLLALHFTEKKGRTAPGEIDLARRRLAHVKNPV